MSVPILLGHNDVLLRLEREGDHWSFLAGGEGHMDLPRSRQGGLAGSFFAVWVPRYLDEPDPDEETVEDDEGARVITMAAPLDPDYAMDRTLSMMDKLLSMEEDSDGELVVVRSKADLARCLDDDLFAAILHFEGAEAIDPSLEDLEEYYAHGLRSLGIVWSRPNLFGYGVQFAFPASPDTGPGLTAAGVELVRACNSLGIMLDVSHLTEEGFWDVARVSRAPLVATHSNAFALCPSSRNLTDDQLRAVRDTGGLVGINFGVADLRPDGEDDPDTPLELVYDQIDYIAELIGLEHVAIGSDFDGNVVPSDLEDVAVLSEVMEALKERGFSQDDLEKIGYGNWLRVLEQSWDD